MSSNEADEVPPMIRQQQLVEELASLLVNEHRGDDWTSLRYQANTLAGYKEHLIHARSAAGDETTEHPPYAAIRKLNELRSVMYRPGVGTWFSLTLSMDPTGRASADFNYDEEPAWATPATGQLYAQDFEKFPRDETATPEWLKQRLAEAHNS